jgi:hypothetical protein
VTADIEAAFAAQLGAGSAGVGAEADAGLTVAVGKLVTLLEKQRADEQRMYRAIFSRPLRPQSVAVASSAFLITSREHDLGPPDGYAWAVQRLTIGGLTTGATPDSAAFYRGVPSLQAVDPALLLNTVTGNAPAWHPGRTAFILQPGESIIAANLGTVAATGNVTLTGEIIQMEQWLLPHFLL